jgi:hypothetical protein
VGPCEQKLGSWGIWGSQPLPPHVLAYWLPWGEQSALSGVPSITRSAPTELKAMGPRVNGWKLPKLWAKIHLSSL